MDIDKEDSRPKESRLKFTKTPIWGLSISCVFLIWLIVTTNPGAGGPKIVIFFLSIFFLFTLCLVSILLQLIWSFIGIKSDYSWYRLLYSSTLFAFGMVFLLGLQTLSQLRLIDVILVLMFEAVVNFYILRRF